MPKTEKSLELFTNGYSCAQAVLIVFADDVGFDKDVAFSIGAGLGGGIGRTQNICGAINAGAIVLGIKYGNYPSDDLEAKKRLGSLVGSFVNECKEKLGSTQCLELVKVDLTNETQKQFAEESGHLEKVCNNAIKVAIETLENYLKKVP